MFDCLNKDSTEKMLKSVCMIGELPTKWTHQNVQYMIEKSDDGPSFEKCYSNVLKTIEGKFLSLPELNSKEIYAFSYFFDRFRSARLLKKCKFKKKIVFFSYYI